jgi:hypothetical protein
MHTLREGLQHKYEFFSFSRLKELAAFIHHFFRNHLALSLILLFKPGASPEKGSAGEIIIRTIPTVLPRYLLCILISFHSVLINEALWQ